jgi:hypothetical protein
MQLLKREIPRARIVMYERASNLYVPVQRFLPSPSQSLRLCQCYTSTLVGFYCIHPPTTLTYVAIVTNKL